MRPCWREPIGLDLYASEVQLHEGLLAARGRRHGSRGQYARRSAPPSPRWRDDSVRWIAFCSTASCRPPAPILDKRRPEAGATCQADKAQQVTVRSRGVTQSYERIPASRSDSHLLAAGLSVGGGPIAPMTGGRGAWLTSCRSSHRRVSEPEDCKRAGSRPYPPISRGLAAAAEPPIYRRAAGGRAVRTGWATSRRVA